MDLRRAIFLKRPLHESIISNNSLNSSSASMYESASEDLDSSLYYSFTESQDKISLSVQNDSIKLNDQDVDEEQSSIVSEADKENTIILRNTPKIKESQANVIASEHSNSQNNDVTENEKEKNQEIIIIKDDPVIDISSDSQTEVEEETLMSLERESKANENKTNKTPTVLIIPEIVIQDPNENIINPFTMPVIPSSATASSSSTLPSIIEETNKTPERRSNSNDFKKKSASKIPTRSHFYSPVQRKSIDKKTKINIKPSVPMLVQKRRTIYETRSRVTVNSKASEIPVSEVQPNLKTSKMTTVAAPKPAIIKPSLYKCTISSCNREFRLLKTYQDHQKTHNTNIAATSSSSSSFSFKCNWCDKTFNLENALGNHKLEKCPKIPFQEKRKLISLEAKKEKPNDKRKSMFIAPAPKKRSPSRRQTLNKSGVLITPKKTLKCHKCGKLFTDVLEFANHTISHKYETVNGQKA